MHPLQAVEDALLAQRGKLIGWVPVALGTGIGWYFAQTAEPVPLFWAAAALAGLVLLGISRLLPVAWVPLALGMFLALGGAGLAKFRTENVAAPVLTFRYYGPIEGRVVDIDRSASDAVRLTLDRVVLARMSPERTPARVRVAVHGDQPPITYNPGDTLILTGHLSPPGGPAEPGGFDFQRHAWFAGIGAVGYTRTPVLRLALAPTGSTELWVFRQRMALSGMVQAIIPGEAGAFAAAIMTGDRAGMGQGTIADLRASNLAHLLAISGLHMGLLTGFIFAGLRAAFALCPYLALRWPVKKIAAVCAIGTGFFYLLLSGGNVATERAFIMVSMMFVAVLLDRRALTLRAVAMAAIVVLVLHPEALGGPGFQMSFAATTALVVVFRAMRHVNTHRIPRWLRPVLSVFVSSLVAGLATAPFAAAHFNQISHYGLIANLLSVPLMGALVMPAAVLAVCLAPFGLMYIGLWPMELGLRWILYVAHEVAGLDGALSHVVAPGHLVLPLLTLGLLWLILWQGRLRVLGAGVAASAFAVWSVADRPALLIADNGALMGQMTAAGRALSRGTGNSFVAGIWLENDGAPVPQEDAAARPGFLREGRLTRTTIGGFDVLQVSGKTALADLVGCDGADIVVSNQLDAGARPCLVYDVRALRSSGAIAMNVNADGGLQITTVRAVAGIRPWNDYASVSADEQVTQLISE